MRLPGEGQVLSQVVSLCRPLGLKQQISTWKRAKKLSSVTSQQLHNVTDISISLTHVRHLHKLKLHVTAPRSFTSSHDEHHVTMQHILHTGPSAQSCTYISASTYRNFFSDGCSSLHLTCKKKQEKVPYFIYTQRTSMQCCSQIRSHSALNKANKLATNRNSHL